MEKDIALVCCIIHQEDILGGTLFQTFDEIYDLAAKFVAAHKKEKWEDRDFEEAVVEWAAGSLGTGPVYKTVTTNPELAAAIKEMLTPIASRVDTADGQIVDIIYTALEPDPDDLAEIYNFKLWPDDYEITQ